MLPFLLVCHFNINFVFVVTLLYSFKVMEQMKIEQTLKSKLYKSKYCVIAPSMSSVGSTKQLKPFD